MEKPADTEQKIEKILAERWSGRAYDPTTPVSNEQVTAICEAARWAPSCFGDAPWRYIVWNRHEDEASWQKALECLVPGNQAWAKNASVLILAASVQSFSHNDKPNNWNGYDTGAASVSLCVQASAMGLMSHQMGGFEADKLKTTFAIPDNINLWSMIAIGHPAALDTLDEEQLTQELKARERRPLVSQFYANDWNIPLN
ncbi:MAG TPA: nitroreductase [Methylophaga sp.]|nr:nitroreductase [Methylophaga sp.]HEC60570.1 nitroreductase [Methylophaga sp.]